MSMLFGYKILFMTELLVAEAVCTTKLARRKNFIIRLISCIFVCYLGAILFPIIDDFSYTWYGSSIMFLSLFLLTIISMFICFKAKFLTIFFCAIIAYTIQHLSYELFYFIYDIAFLDTVNVYSSDVLNFSDINGMTFLAIFMYIDMYILVYVNSYCAIGSKLGVDGDFHIKNFSIFLFVVFIVFTDIILNAIIQAIVKGNVLYIQLSRVYNILCCLMVLYIQSSLSTVRDVYREKDILEKLFDDYKEQYNLKRENIDLINQKCHDLKHQILLLTNKRGVNEEISQEIQDLISIYDTSVKTGNETLDIILSEKSLVCHKEKITLTCMADGKLLNFMHENDICILLGNIIDNAIEAVASIAEQERRCINFHLNQVGQMVCIKTDNYYDGEIKLDKEGLPITTKSSKDYHGFGVRSIKSIVHKYGGDSFIKTEQNIYSLHIMIPIQKEGE